MMNFDFNQLVKISEKSFIRAAHLCQARYGTTAHPPACRVRQLATVKFPAMLSDFKRER
jgi:hypothetical protein